jgi:methionyl-tRNA formyltransferase
MKEIGAQLLVRTVQGLAEDTLKEQPQASFDVSALRHAPKIFTETCAIDWNKGVQDVHNLIRGLSPYPGAVTKLNGKILKIYKSQKEVRPVEQKPGEVLSDNKNYLKFTCADGYITVLDMQLEGKKRMAVEDFLRGNKIN